MGKYGEAADDFTLDIQLEPNHGAAYFLRGQCYLKLASYQNAVNDFRRTAELDPNLREQAIALLQKAHIASVAGRSYSQVSSGVGNGPGA
jgi:tetratricopeptide (TPR) repeat protein